VELDHFPPLRELSAIGDGHSVAILDREGTVVWLCLPEIDSPSAFAALLDPERGGRFWLRPAIPFEVSRRYVPHTNVLETRFTTDRGVVRLTDAINFGSLGALRWVELARRIDALSGQVPMEWAVHPSFEYGQTPARFAWRNGHPVTLFSEGSLGVLAFDAGEVRLTPERVSGRFELASGKSALLALVCGDDAPLELPPRAHLEARLGGTIAHWRRWVTGMQYAGEWEDAVERSALTLALSANPSTGAIIAAATCSLPERLGGDRNWDYRFCWTRDLSFTLDALMALGFREAAAESLRWLLGAVAGTRPEVEPIYLASGGRLQGVAELPLKGYRGARPVQIGNRAERQLQLGAYGDLFATVASYVAQGNLLSPSNGTLLAELADRICATWRRADSSIWELEEARQYTVSKLGCWVALDRALWLSQEGQLPPQGRPRWERERQAIRDFIETACWSEARQSYVQYAGGDTLDAGTLLAGRTGFSRDPARLSSTVDALGRELGRGALLYRFSGADQLEGTFWACAFWRVDALCRVGRLEEAARLMDTLVGQANDLGLYSEEQDPATGAFLGNFPQALTHLSLINAAVQFQRCRPR
jgi:GH15 family glucan-1,4-alpha-glucosidase